MDVVTILKHLSDLKWSPDHTLFDQFVSKLVLNKLQDVRITSLLVDHYLDHGNPRRAAQILTLTDRAKTDTETETLEDIDNTLLAIARVRVQLRTTVNAKAALDLKHRLDKITTFDERLNAPSGPDTENSRERWIKFKLYQSLLWIDLRRTGHLSRSKLNDEVGTWLGKAVGYLSVRDDVAAKRMEFDILARYLSTDPNQHALRLSWVQDLIARCPNGSVEKAITTRLYALEILRKTKMESTLEIQECENYYKPTWNTPAQLNKEISRMILDTNTENRLSQYVKLGEKCLNIGQVALAKTCVDRAEHYTHNLSNRWAAFKEIDSLALKVFQLTGDTWSANEYEVLRCRAKTFSPPQDPADLRAAISMMEKVMREKRLTLSQEHAIWKTMGYCARELMMFDLSDDCERALAEHQYTKLDHEDKSLIINDYSMSTYAATVARYNQPLTDSLRADIYKSIMREIEKLEASFDRDQQHNLSNLGKIKLERLAMYYNTIDLKHPEKRAFAEMSKRSCYSRYQQYRDATTRDTLIEHLARKDGFHEASAVEIADRSLEIVKADTSSNEMQLAEAHLLCAIARRIDLDTGCLPDNRLALLEDVMSHLERSRQVTKLVKIAEISLTRITTTLLKTTADLIHLNKLNETKYLRHLHEFLVEIEETTTHQREPHPNTDLSAFMEGDKFETNYVCREFYRQVEDFYLEMDLLSEWWVWHERNRGRTLNSRLRQVSKDNPRELPKDTAQSAQLENSMNQVELDVLKHLPAEYVIERNAPGTFCRVLLTLKWNPLGFVQTQKYAESSQDALTWAITITGSACDAQAATTYDYLVQTWPITGSIVMQTLREAVCAENRCATSNLPDGTRVKLQLLVTSASTVEIFGNISSIVEVVQQFSWLGAALRSSTLEDGIEFCTPIVRGESTRLPSQKSAGLKSGSLTVLAVDFNVTRMDSDRSVPGHCWHKMFQNPVVVKGYPILTRSSQGQGVEMPLDMIARIARAERVNRFDGKIFLKGFSTMLLAVQLIEGLLVWHYLYSERGERISYLDHIVQETDDIALHQLDTVRHVVGWCEGAEYHAGSATAKYDIDSTGLKPPHAGCLLEKASLGGGKFVTASLTIALGVKDIPPHITVKGYVNQLASIATEYFVLWDEADKRGWLINGASTLLHLVRTSLSHYSKELAFAFIFDFDKMSYPDVVKPGSAMKVLYENRELAIFPDKSETSKEDSREQFDGSVNHKKVLKKRMGYFLFQDLVEQHYNTLELVADYHRHVAGKNGINMKLRVRKHLEGWDFVELATSHKNLNPRIATISALGYGWVDFVRSINAVPLFGRGFGDVIKPAESSDAICSHWSTLPRHKYYLAVSMYDMKRVTNKHGDKHASPPVPVHGLVWHCPEKLLAPRKCRRSTGQSRCSTTDKHHDPVQTFWPAKSKLLLQLRSPGDLQEDIAVVFGHNVTWGFRWKEDGKEDLEKEQDSQAISVSGPTTMADEMMLEFLPPALGSSLSMSSTSPQARDGSARPTARVANVASGSSSHKSRVYTITNSSDHATSSVQTSQIYNSQVSSLSPHQTLTKTMSPSSTNRASSVPAMPEPAGIVDSKGGEQRLTSKSGRPQQAVKSANGSNCSDSYLDRAGKKPRKRRWQRFWRRDAV